MDQAQASLPSSMSCHSNLSLRSLAIEFDSSRLIRIIDDIRATLDLDVAYLHSIRDRHRAALRNTRDVLNCPPKPAFDVFGVVDETPRHRQRHTPLLRRYFLNACFRHAGGSSGVFATSISQMELLQFAVKFLHASSPKVYTALSWKASVRTL